MLNNEYIRFFKEGNLLTTSDDIKTLSPGVYRSSGVTVPKNNPQITFTSDQIYNAWILVVKARVTDIHVIWIAGNNQSIYHLYGYNMLVDPTWSKWYKLSQS